MNISKTKEKINVFAHHAEQTAVGYYRIIRPAMALNKIDGIKVSTFPFSAFGQTPSVAIEDMEKIVAEHDLLFFSRVDNPNIVVLMKALKDPRYYKHLPMLMDIDDLAKYTTSDNPAYVYYSPQSKTNSALWGEEQLGLCDGWITTSKYIGKMLKHINPHYHVIPNCADFNLIERWEKPKAHKDIRIGWAGAMAHQVDLEILKNVIPRILDENKNVTFYFFGLIPGWAKKLKRVKHIGWTNFKSYFNILSKMGWDIALAPLQDNHFNRAKSNLKWVEYSQLKIPTVASKVYPYAESIKNKVDGFICSTEEEWYSVLTSLIKSRKLRLEIGKNAYNRVKKDYNIDIWKYKYLEIFKKYLSKRRKRNGNNRWSNPSSP